MGRQASRNAGGAPHFKAGYRLEVRIQVIERRKHRAQFTGGLLANAGNPGDVVRAIAGQRQEIGNSLRNGTETGANVVIVVPDLAGIVPERIAVTHQLRQILVARHQHVAKACGARAHGHRADDVVRLVFRAGVLGKAHVTAKFPAQPELAREVRGCRLAVRLVGRIDGGALRGLTVEAVVKRDAQSFGAHLLHEIREEAREAV